MASQTEPKGTVLITGASRGIGYELSKLFARDGYRLILVARDQEKVEEVAAELESTYACEAAPMPKDLTVARAADEVFEKLSQHGIEIDILVNNAGVASRGPFYETDTQWLLDLLQLNITSLTHLTRLFLPGMVARGRGRILNVASTAAFLPGPYMATYYASKGFVLSFSEALWWELRGTGVTVTTVCPGPTDTDFHKASGMKLSPLAEHGGVLLKPAIVAQAGYRATMKGKRIVVPGIQYKTVAFLCSRLLPKSIALRIVATLNRNR